VNFATIQPDSKNIQFGDYGLIASQVPVVRQYVETKDIGKPAGPKAGDVVWLRGRVAGIRAKGNACFIVIRAGSFYTIQACHFKDKEHVEESKALLKYASGLTLESIVDIQGVVTEADVKSCSQKNVEIHIRKIFAVSRAPAALPFLLEDAARPESEIEATAGSERPLVGVTQVRTLHYHRYGYINAKPLLCHCIS
jgi:aspartyl-tRNA synthetase